MSRSLLGVLLLLVAQAFRASHSSRDLPFFLNLKIKPKFPNMVFNVCQDLTLAYLTCISLPASLDTGQAFRPSFHSSNVPWPYLKTSAYAAPSACVSVQPAPHSPAPAGPAVGNCTYPSESSMSLFRDTFPDTQYRSSLRHPP